MHHSHSFSCALLFGAPLLTIFFDFNPVIYNHYFLILHGVISHLDVGPRTGRDTVDKEESNSLKII